MTDPETKDVDETEDIEEAELLAQEQNTFEVQPFDADGNPIWDEFG